MLQINDLSRKIAKHRSQILASIERVLNSGWLILGPEIERFENSFASYLGAGHCKGLANGTDAIEIGLKAMGVNGGDRVATAANAGMYSTSAVMAIGAEPFYMDVDLETKGITLSEVRRAVEAGVKAVVATHLYGIATPEIASIANFCLDSGIPLLEDCAQAHGAKIGDRNVGTFGDASSYSFYPTKNLGALGDGGAIVTNNSTLAEKVSSLRQYGWTTKYKVEAAGARNSRLDEMQAAILSDFLPHLDEANARRREIATHYSRSIRHPDVTVPRELGLDYVAHLYVIRSKDREVLRQYLLDSKISTDIHYPIPDYRQPIFDDKFTEMNLLNTELLASEVLTLPCYPEMSDREVDQVISAINGWKA